MLQFLPGYAWFAIAGAAAATGPVLIHLLNRRRFRVVHWAAMDFLREAIRRNRRILEFRDLVLLFLRTLAVLLFGLALARPFVPADAGVGWRVALPAAALALACGLAAAALSWGRKVRAAFAALAVGFAAAAVYFGGEPYWTSSTTAAVTADSTQPTHAVLLIDNSLSMSYALERSLLDEAKDRALRLIDRLPEGSHVAVLPVCGPHDRFSLDPYPSKDDARTAVERIAAVDRQATSASVIALAREACAQAPEFPAAAKRVVLFSDVQEMDWPAGFLSERIADLPELQVVDVSAVDPANAWVASVELEDGVADTQTPTKINARVRYIGREPRENVQVSLWVNDTEVASQTIGRLDDGATREVVFHHQFELDLSPGQTRHVPLRVSLAPDRLVMDDSRCLAATVVAALPVVFVDELGGEGEQPARQAYGETLPLRRIIAPSAAGDSAPPLVEVRHVTIDRLDRKLLADARLVVVAGVEKPIDAAVELLADYISQGGQVIIAAGAKFDTAAWNEIAWRDGRGILPAPLDGTVGQSIEDDPEKLEPFYIDYDSLAGRDEFHVAGESAESQKAFYRDPWFFKAVRVDAGQRRIDEFVAAESRRIERQRAERAEFDARLAEWRRLEADGKLSADDAAARDAELARRGEAQVRWLAWPADRSAASMLSMARPESEARAAAPRVLARFDNGLPFLVERRIGQGDVLFIATSVRSGWNTWPRSYTMFLADRLMRRRIERTLPIRDVPTGRDTAIAVDPNEAERTFAVTRPDGAVVVQEAEALDADTYGVTVGGIYHRGFYRIERRESDGTNAAAEETDTTSDTDSNDENGVAGTPRGTPPVLLAANGPAEESQLAPADRRRLVDSARASGKLRWIAPGESVSIEGASVRGQNLWWWLVATVAACLVVEMTALAIGRK